ncbi:hypothetical protein IJM86_04335 [bacterium]|nr:hypothetical protein [bacterium]
MTKLKIIVSLLLLSLSVSVRAQFTGECRPVGDTSKTEFYVAYAWSVDTTKTVPPFEYFGMLEEADAFCISYLTERLIIFKDRKMYTFGGSCVNSAMVEIVKRVAHFEIKIELIDDYKPPKKWAKLFCFFASEGVKLDLSLETWCKLSPIGK